MFKVVMCFVVALACGVMTGCLGGGDTPVPNTQCVNGVKATVDQSGVATPVTDEHGHTFQCQ